MEDYESYKRLRNLLRKYNLQASLEDLWKYAQMLQNNFPMEYVRDGGQKLPISHYVYPWDIPVICRELILNASSTGTKRLRTWDEFSVVLRSLRDVENSMAMKNKPSDVLLMLQPIVQQQFAWQQKQYLHELVRALKIFSAPDVDALLIRETGVPAKVWFFVGFAIAGAMFSHSGINSNQNYEFAGISRAQSDLVFQRISTTYEKLKEITQREQKYDERWKFTLNPMLSWPLLSLQPGQPHLLHCPLPIYVLQRVSSGLYYEIVSKPGFEKHFGKAVESYVGDVVSLTFPQPRFTIQSEQEYWVGKNKKLTTDWIISDDEAIVLIECKSKRMTPEGKVSSDPEVLRKEVEALAKAVVQIYKGISDAYQNLTPWKPNGRSIYPAVLTLEEWYLFGPVEDLLRQEIEKLMRDSGLDLKWINDMPYAVLSCAEFEMVSSTIAYEGLKRFFSNRFSAEFVGMPLRDFALRFFPEIYRKTASRQLFEDEWRGIFPAAALPKNFGEAT